MSNGSPRNSYTFEEMDFTSSSSSDSFHERSSIHMSPIKSPKRFTESTDLEDNTDSSTAEEYTEDNLYELVDVPIQRFNGGSSLPSVYTVRNWIAFRKQVRNRSVVWCGLLLLFGLLVIAIVALSTTLAVHNQKSPASSPTSIAADDEERPTPLQVKNFLVGQGIVETSEDAMNTQGTPQHEALLWIAQKDLANLPVPDDDDADDERTSYLYVARYIMALNYFAMGGPDWDHPLYFLSEKSICEWYSTVNDDQAKGVWCDDEGLPTSILLPGNGLTNELPAENGYLTSLVGLDLSGNSLEGSIPDEMCNLVDLGFLYLDGNSFEGSIPSCIGDMKALSELNLANNSLQGPLPRSMEHLTALQRLVLSDNDLDGNPHVVIKNLNNLRWLLADSNHFTGYINAEMFEGKKDIEVVDLSNNQFSGHFHPFLQLETLTSLDLSGNQLRDSFPEYIPRNTKLQVLALQGNAFLAGWIHNSIGNLTALTDLILSDNAFLGNLPSAIGSLEHLETLFLANNPRLKAGAIPAEFSNLSKLTELSLQNTNRQGDLPSFENQKKLRFLDLANNDLQGNIPDSWAALTNLKALLLSNNPNIVGSLPETLDSLTNLELVLLDSTGTSGDLEFLCHSMALTAPDEGAITVNCGTDHAHVECPCCVCCGDDEPWCSQDSLPDLAEEWETSLRDDAFALPPSP